MVILAHNFSIRKVFFQADLEFIRQGVTEGIVLAKDIKFLFLFANLAVVIGAGLAEGAVSREGLKNIGAKMLRIHQIIGAGQGVYMDDFVLCSNL